MLFLGDYSDEGGWRGMHFCLESGLVLEIDSDGETVMDREPTAHELLIATVEWCNAHQDSSFPATLYRALNKKV